MSIDGFVERHAKKFGLQRRSHAQINPIVVPPIVNEVLHSPGQPLDTATRAFMEPRFGHDFGKVRVHTDARAAESALAVNALAYTLGRDVVFGAGQYNISTTEGKRLLAHELTHVVQQNGTSILQRQVDETIPTALSSEAVAARAGEVEQSIGSEVAGESESELSPEQIEPLPDVVYVSKDWVPEEEPREEAGIPEAGVAAALAGRPPPSIVPQIAGPDHPSEREAEAVSNAIVSGLEKGAIPKVSIMPHAGGKFLHRQQIFWDSRNALNWADFKVKSPKGSPFDAETWSGFKMNTPKVQKVVDPWPPLFPDSCKIGKTSTTKFRAQVSLDISLASLNVRAHMQPSKSWVKPGKQSPALLHHEQGHFDISHVIAEKTEFAILLWGIQHSGEGEECGKVPARNAAVKAWNKLNPNKAIQKIFNKGGAVLKQAQDDYDNATGHGVNVAAQQAWLGDINADLPNYKVW